MPFDKLDVNFLIGVVTGLIAGIGFTLGVLALVGLFSILPTCQPGDPGIVIGGMKMGGC